MEQFLNRVWATLAAGITDAQTSITLTTGQGARFSALTAGNKARFAIIDNANNIEIIYVTDVTGDTLTVLRGQDGSTARAYSVGDRIEARVGNSTMSHFVQQSGEQTFAVAAGTADAMTAAFSPTLTELKDGQPLRVRAVGANTLTNPTLNPDTLGGLTIYKTGGVALAPGDIVGAGHELLLTYRASPARLELANPGSSSISAFAPHAASTPNMTVKVDAGSMLVNGALVVLAQQTTGTIVAPVSLPRIDRVVMDATTGTISVVAGTENAIPVAPAIPPNKIPVMQFPLTVGMTAITNAIIIDERPAIDMTMPNGSVGSAKLAPIPNTSGTDTYTVTLGLTAWADGQPVSVHILNPNATTTPSLAPDSLAAKTMVNQDGSAVAVGQMSGPMDFMYDLTSDKLLLKSPKSSSSSVSVPKRQTVLAGAAAIVQIGTGLACNLLATATPVRIAYPGGMGANGAIDYVGSFTADQASIWSGLTANVTNYLFADRNVSTGAQTGVASTLPYIAQPSGGTVSVVNNQHTYEYDTGVMWFGNGSTASVAQRVAVGECVCGASTVTSVITYAKQRMFYPAFTATLPSAGVTASFNHYLGTPEIDFDTEAECTTADAGYSVGDRVTGLMGFTTAPYMVGVKRATRLTCAFTGGDNATNTYIFVNASTGAGTFMTKTSWKYRMVAKGRF